MEESGFIMVSIFGTFERKYLKTFVCFLPHGDRKL
jgi:hypothetical protein